MTDIVKDIELAAHDLQSAVKRIEEMDPDQFAHISRWVKESATRLDYQINTKTRSMVA